MTYKTSAGEMKDNALICRAMLFFGGSSAITIVASLTLKDSLYINSERSRY